MSDVDNSRKRSHSSLSTDDPDGMDAIYEAWYEACDKWGDLQARRMFAHFLHEPPPAGARPKKSILKKPSIGVVDPKPAPPPAEHPYHRDIVGLSEVELGLVDEDHPGCYERIAAFDAAIAKLPPYGPVEAQAFVDKQVGLKRWEKIEAWSLRAPVVTDSANPPELVWMDFVVESRKHRTWDCKAELKLAGYGHWVGCTHGGWSSNWLTYDGKPIESRGSWGKRITNVDRLEYLHERRDFWVPSPHPSGDGWLCAGVHYERAKYPLADAWGPRGGNGPKYGSNWCGD